MEEEGEKEERREKESVAMGYECRTIISIIREIVSYGCKR